MKLEVGKAYRTRDGRKVVITEVNNTQSDDCWGFIDGRKSSLSCWYMNGRFYADKSQPLDLIAEWEEPAAQDGWIEWHGGKCPVPGDVTVDYTLRDGEGSSGALARCLRWTHVGNDYDIIAYRIVKPSYEGVAPLEISGGEQTAAVVAPSPRPWEQSIADIRRESCAVACILAAVEGV